MQKNPSALLSIGQGMSVLGHFKKAMDQLGTDLRGETRMNYERFTSET